MKANFDTQELSILRRNLERIADRDARKIMRFATTDAGRAGLKVVKNENVPLGDYSAGRIRSRGMTTGRNSGSLQFTIKTLSNTPGLSRWVSPSQLRQGGRPGSPITARGIFGGQTIQPSGAFSIPSTGQVFRRKGFERFPVERFSGPTPAITARARAIFDATNKQFQIRFFESAWTGLSHSLRAR